MPGAAIGIDLRIGRVRQRAMHGLPLLRRGRAIDGRADQRVTKGHARAPIASSPSVSAAAWTPIPSRPAARHTSTGSPTGSAAATSNSRWVSAGSPASRTAEAVLDPPRQRKRVRQTEPAGQLSRRQPPRQLQQRQRVTARLRDQPLPHPLVQRNADRRAQQRARVTITQTLDHQLRQSLELITRLTRHQHQRDRLRQQPPRHEHERLRRGAIKPLRVINHTHKRLLLGHLRQQAQHRQPDQKPIRRVPRPQPERHAQRVLLRGRKPVQPIEHRRAQLLQGRERELHLRLDTDRPHDPEPRRGPDRGLQQRRLADPRLAAHHQHPALPTTHRLKQPIQRLALAAPAVQHLRRPLGDHAKATIPRSRRPWRTRHDYAAYRLRTRRLVIRATRCALTLLSTR